MKSVIVKSIEILASPEKVWRVFRDPVVTRKMGGEYISSWKVGSPFGWQGLDGKMYTHGKIVQLEEKELLKYSLFNTEDNKIITSEITYRLQGNYKYTILYAREDITNLLSDVEHEEASLAWDAALQTVKQLAEGLQY